MQQIASGNRIAGRDGTIDRVLAAGEESLVVAGSEVEAPSFLVLEQFDLLGGDFVRGGEPLFVTGRLMESDEAVHQEGVVVEISIEFGFATFLSRRAIGPKQPAFFGPQVGEDEVGGFDSGGEVAVVLEDAGSIREAADHQAVVRGQNFGVGERAGPLAAGVEELFADGRELCFEFRLRHLQCLGIFRHRHGELRGVELLFEIGLSVQAIHHREKLKLFFGQELLHLDLFPTIELPFLILGIGVEGREKAATGVGHFVKDKVAQFFADAAEILSPRQAVGFRIDAGELAVVVEHFLEVGNPPETVGAIAMKAAAEVVANAPHFHFLQREGQHPLSFFVFTPLHAVDEVGQIARLREFWASIADFAKAKTSPFFVELPFEFFLHRGIECIVNRRQDGGPPGFELRLGVFDDGLAVLANFVRRLCPNLLHPLHQREKARGRAAVAVAGGKVGAAKDRLRLGGEKHAHRPSSAAAGTGELVVDLQGGHVDAVDVRPLFPVHLDADEVLVEVGRDFVVQK